MIGDIGADKYEFRPYGVFSKGFLGVVLGSSYVGSQTCHSLLVLFHKKSTVPGKTRPHVAVFGGERVLGLAGSKVRKGFSGPKPPQTPNPQPHLDLLST